MTKVHPKEILIFQNYNNNYDHKHNNNNNNNNRKRMVTAPLVIGNKSKYNRIH